jgi:Zn-dependent protease
MDIISIIMQVAILIFAVIVHEVSHGYVANMLGDPTAKLAGRLTLNPLPHIDPVMSILLPVICIISGSPVFGGAKPVPINPVYFRNRKRDTMLVGLAGPGSNLIMALIGVGLFVAAAKISFLRTQGLFMFLQYVIFINLILAVFNLIPIPPLDGSHIVMGFISEEAAVKYASIGRFGIPLIFILAYMGFFGAVFKPILLGTQNLLNYLIQ